MKNKNFTQYWTEDYLYFIYKLLNSQKISQKKSLDFEFFRSPEKSLYSVLHHLRKLASEVKIELNNVIFHKNIYKMHCQEDYKKIESQIKRTKSLGEEETLNSFFNNLKPTVFKDLLGLPLTQVSMLNWIEFNAKLPKKTFEGIKKYFDKYIKSYIEEKLINNIENIIVFSKQKKAFTSIIDELVSSYGNEILIKEQDVFSSNNTGLLFIHNIVALESLDLLKIKELFILDYDSDISKQKEAYIAKIKIQKKFSDNIDKSAKKTEDILKKISDNKLIFYDIDGIAEYKNVKTIFKYGTKEKELLNFLHNSKNTTFDLRYFQENCNKKIEVNTHKFKNEKDISDTILRIRKKFKVSKGEYFPIRKKGKCFIWEEK